MPPLCCARNAPASRGGSRTKRLAVAIASPFLDLRLSIRLRAKTIDSAKRANSRIFFCHGKQHTGSIPGHNHLMDVVASLSRDSKIGPVRVNHKVLMTGDGTRNQGDVEISNFPISLGWSCH